ncbi:MAG: hypothetical protein JW849_07710 [Phycisphaerae bacterium]|nr:hypothetical protein [Phycisphaerae bacterium]
MDGHVTTKTDLQTRRKDSRMLISRNPGETTDEQGGSAVDFAHLRRRLSDPALISRRDRQRLMELAQRVARVRAMGDEYLRVNVSDYVFGALPDAVGA